jgi:primosomal protein N' (replication factor Y)
MRLSERFGGTFPSIRQVTITFAKGASPDSFWITKELKQAIAQRLAKKEQVLIFINRRGLKAFVQCTGCAHIIRCTACSVSLTVHAQQKLLCHYCGFERIMPVQCDSCAQRSLVSKGIGTQRIVELLTELFPSARIARADKDQTREQKRWSELLAQMHEGLIDILVGTQTITKGYTFPRLTLVGIIWAECNLALPFYAATEHTVQHILQVAGRAGRASASSEVLVQSFADHALFAFLDERLYTDFYAYEIEQRKDPAYPPFVRLSEMELQHTDEHALLKDAHDAAAYLRGVVGAQGWDVQILGPCPPPVAKIKHISRVKMYFKSQHIAYHIQLCKMLRTYFAQKGSEIRCIFIPSPLQ